MEAASKNAVDLRGDSSTSEVNQLKQRKMQGQKGGPSTSSSNSDNGSCYCCGEKNHRSPACKFNKSTCHACGKIGHLARVCLSRGRANQRNSNFAKQTNTSRSANQRVHQVENDSSEEEATPVYELFSVSTVAGAPPAFQVKVKIEGIHATMEVDTGAPVTIVPFAFFRNHESVFAPLQKTSMKLRSFTRHELEIAGTTNVTVEYKNQRKLLPLVVVHQSSVMLMGRSWIRDLGVLKDLEDQLFTNAIQESKQSLKDILEKHNELFADGLGKVKNVQVHLKKIADPTPRFFKARPVPYAYRVKVEQEIDRFLELGALEPVQYSDWATPVVPVLKSNGNVRLCGDFKLTVNVATELKCYPLPNVEDLFARLSGGVTFSKIDLSDAYCQLELDDSSKDLLVINTHRGLFQYCRLPFGVASAPAIFQREMDKLLQGHDRALCYLDDLLVTGDSAEDHLRNLDSILTTLQTAGIKLHPSKCSFMQPSVEYLGHRIDAEGLHPIQTKVEAIERAPDPTNVDELRSFLGLLTYHAKFLPNMSTMLAPLYQLLNKDQQWRWGAVEKQSFREAKRKLTTSSLLVHFDESKEVHLECDASPYGVGAVLSHPSDAGDRPIAFASRSLTKAEKNYSQLEREALALVFGVIRYRKFLLGRTFTLVTDHQPLVSLFSEKKPIAPMAASRIQRWAIILSAYSYRIVYRKGSLHSNADACSRLPVEATRIPSTPRPADVVLLLDAIDDCPVTVQHFQRELDANPIFMIVKEYIHRGWPKLVDGELRPFWMCRAELSVEGGVILRGNRVFVPPKFRKYVLAELHAGHQGMCALKAMGRQAVWWPNIDKEIESLVRACVVCQEHAPEPPSQLAPWPYTKIPWDRIHIDHAGPFENHLILLVVDAATKWLEAILVPSTSSTATVTALRSVFARFGLPRTVVSDNGSSFTSQEFTDFMKKSGIIHVRTAPYHPQSNGQAERLVRTMKDSLKKNQSGTFQERLDNFLFHYRKAPNVATGL
ncbi:hypothetical protein JTE90_025808 [Oedothorax gibbosus]|uniref:RNA-directed DNA polymerase n=1 Tax=Oedothorax gibbosus TaxID=931172 RepID=A0AAV6TRT4_9ARAC|nr:hypothetical protein JTE90_025808 [Oedothorax gibbosus]